MLGCRAHHAYMEASRIASRLLELGLREEALLGFDVARSGAAWNRTGHASRLVAQAAHVGRQHQAQPAARRGAHQRDGGHRGWRHGARGAIQVSLSWQSQ